VSSAVVKRSELLRAGKVDRLDAEYFDPIRLGLEDALHAADAQPLRRVAALSDVRTDPSKGNDEFQYVEIGGVEGRDGFVLSERIPRDDAPSRARMKVSQNLTGVSSVRPLRNQVFFVTADLDGSVASTGFFFLKPLDGLQPQLLFAFLKTTHAIAQLDRRARASMYPTVAPEDALDILFPRIEASVAESIIEGVDQAARERRLFLKASEELARTVSEFFAPMEPETLSSGLASRGHRLLSREALAAAQFDRLDAEYHAPAFDSAFARMDAVATTCAIGEIASAVSTGKSPAVDEFEDDRDTNAVVLKQGCLTGLGVRWADVSFAPSKYLDLRGNDAAEGDILFTSTAHQPLYIGHRVDVVSAIPASLNRRLTFSGDLMRIRIDDQRATPSAFLAQFLRSPLGREQVRRCVRGVSSHVYPEDIKKLRVPLPDLALAKKVRDKAAKVERHRWRYAEHVRRSIDVLQAHVDESLPSS
jgi:hypothetical protein